MTWRPDNREHLEEQLDAELRFDHEQRIANNIAAGMSEPEARRAARLEFGGLDQVKEECRDIRPLRWFQDLLFDLRYALRTLRRNPGFSAAACLTLALGIGVSTLIFTLVSNVLLKPLPYPHPERLVNLYEKDKRSDGPGAFSYPNFLDVRSEVQSLEDPAAWRFGGGVISQPGEAAFVPGRQVSASLFRVLGVSLLRGRSFREEEDRPGAPRVAIVSERLWEQRFAGNASGGEANLVLEGVPYSVIGVFSRGLDLESLLSYATLLTPVDILTPIGQNNTPALQDREMQPGIEAIARLRTGIPLSSARAELANIGNRLAQAYPKSNAGRDFSVDALQPRVVGDGTGKTLWALWAAVTLLLLIACVNVASLLLARAVSRKSEFAMRVALGAGRMRLMRQCATEAVLLAACGGLLGLIVAVIGIPPFLLMWPGGLPRAGEVQIDWRVLAFAMAASLLSGILFGLAPALRVPKNAITPSIGSGSRSIGSRRLHRAFITSEIALATVLLVGAGLMGRLMLRLTAVDPGLNPRNVLTMHVALSPGPIDTPQRKRAAWSDLLQGVRNVPGVQSAALGDVNPMSEDNNEIGYWTSAAEPPHEQLPYALLAVPTPGYLKAMGIDLLRGRFFEEQDRLGGDPVAVIDEFLAQHAFGAADPIGRQIHVEFLGQARIVGVVRHVRYWGIADDDGPIRDQFYFSFNQIPDNFLGGGAMGLFVRTLGSPLNVLPALRRQIRSSSPDQALYDVHTMDDLVETSLAGQRFLMVVFGVFAALALLLASLGVYGVLAYLTNQRVTEIGARMALGAQPGDVVRLIFRQSFAMILAGIAIGIAGSIAATRALRSLEAGIQPNDPIAFAVVLSVLLAAAMAAVWIPARRASRIDPMKALRQE